MQHLFLVILPPKSEDEKKGKKFADDVLSFLLIDPTVYSYISRDIYSILNLYNCTRFLRRSNQI